MKAKWFIVISIIETVLAGMFLVYALVQREQAIQAYDLAEKCHSKAVQKISEAERMALASQQEAVTQAEIARKLSLALSECNARKK